MKYYVLTEEELIKAGLDPERFTRIYQWYGETEVQGDIGADYIAVDKDGKKLTEEELFEIIDGLDRQMYTGEFTWDKLAKDMEYTVKAKLGIEEE